MTGTVGLFVSGVGAGVIAGSTSCAAAQLGLLAGAVGGGHRPMTPVAGFLGGKLASHTALGMLLGTVGAAVQPGPRTRAVLLGLAALLLILFALDLLGLPLAGRLLRRGGVSSTGTGPTRCGPAVPAVVAARVTRPSAPGRVLLRRVPFRPALFRSALFRPALLRPALLGAATVLVPCGLTLSAELLAVSSRSAPGGAAVMAGFVIGTAPSFGLLGVVLGRAPALLRGLPVKLIGVGLLGLAGWTLLSGLRLGGWWPDPAAAAVTDGRFVQVGADGTQVITIWARDQGYRPAHLTARPGLPTVLVVHTARTTGCTRAFVIPARRIERVLPPDGETRIALGTPTTGRLKFACASGHYPGGIDFRPVPPSSPRTATPRAAAGP